MRTSPRIDNALHEQGVFDAIAAHQGFQNTDDEIIALEGLQLVHKEGEYGDFEQEVFVVLQGRLRRYAFILVLESVHGIFEITRYETSDERYFNPELSIAHFRHISPPGSNWIMLADTFRSTAKWSDFYPVQETR